MGKQQWSIYGCLLRTTTLKINKIDNWGRMLNVKSYFVDRVVTVTRSLNTDFFTKKKKCIPYHTGGVNKFLYVYRPYV